MSRAQQHIPSSISLTFGSLTPHMSSQGDDTPCTLLLNIGGQLLHVVKASIMNPLDQELHHVRMPDTVLKVTLSCLLSNEYSELPLAVPSGEDEDPTNLG